VHLKAPPRGAAFILTPSTPPFEENLEFPGNPEEYEEYLGKRSGNRRNSQESIGILFGKSQENFMGIPRNPRASSGTL